MVALKAMIAVLATTGKNSSRERLAALARSISRIATRCRSSGAPFVFVPRSIVHRHTSVGELPVRRTEHPAMLESLSDGQARRVDEELMHPAVVGAAADLEHPDGPFDLSPHLHVAQKDDVVYQK